MNIASILILLFLAVTFIQSGYDKITDWNGNVVWLKEHFAETFLRTLVPQALVVILALEIAAGIFCLAGVVELYTNSGRVFGYYGAIFAAVTLILLLFGQRVAKDYEGAKTIAIYFILAILAVNWLC
ncbi:MAG: DoxX family membrane protein [Flavobacterium sp.]|nr:MAG: DoxX family membrane protein [Flavobacterium sp.]